MLLTYIIYNITTITVVAVITTIIVYIHIYIIIATVIIIHTIIFLILFNFQSLFDSYFLTIYNTIFTSLPILVFGLTEQDVSQQYLLDNPQCYKWATISSYDSGSMAVKLSRRWEILQTKTLPDFLSSSQIYADKNWWEKLMRFYKYLMFLLIFFPR